MALTVEDPAPSIMVVDDSPENLILLREILDGSGKKVLALPNGKMALKAAERNPPDLILLDINMPGMNGYEVCEELKQQPNLREIPVIFLSALNATEDKLKAFHAGGVDYITKPFHIEEVQARVETHLQLRSLMTRLEFQNANLQKIVDEKVKEISEMQLATIFAMAKLAESRDVDTGLHLERVREYCRVLAVTLADSSPYSSVISDRFITTIMHSSPLHDIGKVAIPDKILLKPGSLSDDEFEVMKMHAIIGAENLKKVNEQYQDNEFIRMGIDIAQHHHEYWNGSGYPRGIAGSDIPLAARIMAVADFYDALCSHRCYRQELDHATVKGMLVERDGTQFDPDVVQAFLHAENEFCTIRQSYRT